jgi:hypothetical protein
MKHLIESGILALLALAVAVLFVSFYSEFGR